MESLNIKSFWFIILSSCFFGMPLVSFGQNVYTFFSNYEAMSSDTSKKYFLKLDNANFFKNNEYSLPDAQSIADGYTLIGTWIRPKAVYYPHPKLNLEAGGHFLKYTGRNEFSDIFFWFTTRYRPTDQLSIIFGNLDANYNHHLIEPLYEPENYLTNRPEAGIQLKYESEKIYADLWIDWEEFIFSGDPFQERFTFGIVSSFTLLNKNNFNLSVPFTFYGTHRGGEIDSSPGTVQTFINIAPGIIFEKTTNTGFIKEYGTRNYYISYSGPDDNSLPFSKGWGIYLTGYAESKYGTLTSAYWHGSDFIAPKGGIIYQGISPHNNDYYEPDRKLFNIKYSFAHEIFKETQLGFVFDLFYDINNKGWMNSAGLYLVLNLDFI
jgi:hypothetical protein